MYEALEQFLAQQDFRKADEQTWELMKQAGNGGNKSYLTYDQVDKFSCSALKKINDLWVKYSQGKFGFSVQKDIWLSVGGNPNADAITFRRFAIKVGWKTGSESNRDSYRLYDEYNFTERGQNGHLPAMGGDVGGNEGRWELGEFYSLLIYKRVANCRV